RVCGEALLALLAVGDDRGTGLLEPAHGVGHGLVVERRELLGRDGPGGRGLRCVLERLWTGNAADGFSRKRHQPMIWAATAGWRHPRGGQVPIEPPGTPAPRGATRLRRPGRVLFRLRPGSSLPHLVCSGRPAGPADPQPRIEATTA